MIQMKCDVRKKEKELKGKARLGIPSLLEGASAGQTHQLVPGGMTVGSGQWHHCFLSQEGTRLPSCPGCTRDSSHH